MRNLPSTLPAGSSVHTVYPGQVFCERKPQLINTILGSCVAVCLWDRRLRFGGMNHHVLPSRPANGELSLRYGDVAVPRLIQRMLDLGSHLGDLQAKMFGGACVLGAPGEYAVGRRNAEVAIAELYRHGIPLIACRLSGSEGVSVLQCTCCGDVWVRAIESVLGKGGRSQSPRPPRLEPDRRFRPGSAGDGAAPATPLDELPPPPPGPCPVCRSMPKGQVTP